MPLLSKLAAWAYEDEYRLISQERDRATQHDTLIKSLVNNAPYPIQLKRVVRAPNRYKLDII